MAINGQLLEKAKAAGARLASAEIEVQSVRKEYHALVRRIHLAGASLREIGQALDLSHQRVQQMVEGAGGSWWQRVWSSRNARGNLNCTFCNRSQDVVAKLIAGPKVFICDACVAAGEQLLSSGGRGPSGGPMTLAVEDARRRCSFCGKRKARLSGPANVCRECLDACRQILIDSGP